VVFITVSYRTDVLVLLRLTPKEHERLKALIKKI